LLDVPAHMALLDERPSGKLCVTYQKLLVVDAIDEIKATTQRIPNVDVVKVGGCGMGVAWVWLNAACINDQVLVHFLKFGNGQLL